MQMVNTIIITAVVSVISTLVLAYFIWVGISVRKLLKKAEDNKRKIDDLDQNLSTSHNDIYNTMSEKEKLLNESLNNNTTELHKRIDDTIQEHVHYDEELHRELDKRFDKVHEKLGNITVTVTK